MESNLEIGSTNLSCFAVVGVPRTGIRLSRRAWYNPRQVCIAMPHRAKRTMFNRYQGDMKRAERNIAVRDFTTEVDARIMIWLPYRRRSNQCGILYPGDRLRSTDLVHWCWYWREWRSVPRSCHGRWVGQGVTEYPFCEKKLASVAKGTLFVELSSLPPFVEVSSVPLQLPLFSRNTIEITLSFYISSHFSNFSRN